MPDLHPGSRECVPGPAAQAAADWWAQFLSDPSPGESGSDLPALLSLNLRSEARYTPEQVQTFADRLACIFQAQLDAGRRASAWTEYGPDEVLTYAAGLAGFELDPLALPVKSFTLLQAGSEVVITRLGPGGAPQQLVPHVEATA
ncbi:hypothetical protein [Deinococcus sp. Marseille-Q6407]|uniref:hypothetical protein n=1 Tax=Deinococcus sp. Marseille-Q6407 TaxID=2969223 RepID=UPI0021C09C9A|nr:hypothetical protein [Deinococcus sp. Marseille-Q6407]